MKVVDYFVVNKTTDETIKFQLILINCFVLRCTYTYIRHNFDISVCIAWYFPSNSDRQVYALYSAVEPESRFKVSVVDCIYIHT